VSRSRARRAIPALLDALSSRACELSRRATASSTAMMSPAPVHVFTRFIGVEFLKQFGDEYDLIKDCSISTRELVEKVEDDPQSG
jgi:hypothetical protein